MLPSSYVDWYELLQEMSSPWCINSHLGKMCALEAPCFFCLHGVFKRHLCLQFTSPGSAAAYAIALSGGGADSCLPSFQDHVPRRKLNPGPAEDRE